jgi:hypothetical protein
MQNQVQFAQVGAMVVVRGVAPGSNLLAADVAFWRWLDLNWAGICRKVVAMGGGQWRHISPSERISKPIAVGPDRENRSD